MSEEVLVFRIGPITQKEAGNKKHFIEIWLRKSFQVNRMREEEQEMVMGTGCVQVDCEGWGMVKLNEVEKNLLSQKHKVKTQEESFQS